MKRYAKYSPETIRQEAQLFLSGDTLPTISRKLRIPISTVSWHLIHPLADIDFEAWLSIRYRLLSRAKSTGRRVQEEWLITSSGLSDQFYHQWNAIDEERRKANEISRR